MLVKHRGVTSFPQSVRRSSGVVKPRLYTLRRRGTDHETTRESFWSTWKKWWNTRIVKGIHILQLKSSSSEQWNHKCTVLSHVKIFPHKMAATFACSPQREDAQEVKIYPKTFLASTTASNLEMCKVDISFFFWSWFCNYFEPSFNKLIDKLRTTSVKFNGMYFVEMTKIVQK